MKLRFSTLVFVFSFHWVRRFFIDLSADFSPCFYYLFQGFFYWQYQQSSSLQSGNKDDQQKTLQSMSNKATRKVSE